MVANEYENCIVGPFYFSGTDQFPVIKKLNCKISGCFFSVRIAVSDCNSTSGPTPVAAQIRTTRSCSGHGNRDHGLRENLRLLDPRMTGPGAPSPM